MTPSEIETAARRRLNAVSDNFWSSEEIIQDCLYFAMLELAREARVIEATSSSTTSVVGQDTYAFPTGASEITRVTYDGKPLTRIDDKQMDVQTGGTSTAISGTPRYFTEFNSNIILQPVPDTASKVIKFWYYAEPTRPDSTSTLDIASIYHDLLVTGTVFYMVSKEPTDPRIGLWEPVWNAAIGKARVHAQRKKRAAGFTRVNREEDLINLA